MTTSRCLALGAAVAALCWPLACSTPRTAATSPEPSGDYGRELAEAVELPPAAAEAPASEPAVAEAAAAEASATEVRPEEAGAHEVAPGESTEPEPAAASADGADSVALLHEAMEAYESAGEFWEQGAFEDALAALDHAYALMISVEPAPDDAVTAQEKENLRQLVSKRVVEIYASRRTAVGEQRLSIPLQINADVEREIRSFQGGERQFFLDSYRRSGYYRPMILEQLASAGLPEQLSWLPLVESGFKDRAMSRANAVGLWQFIASTGYRYGLDRSSWIDERMDPEKATAAALAYLSALHDLFGDWLTALAAYNCGENAVLREIRNQKVAYFDQFWDLYQRLPRETRRYVPRFLATLAILENPAAYGIVLPEPEPPLVWETVEIARATQLEALDRALELAPGTLARLNPELRRNGSPDAAYALKVPPGTGGLVPAKLAALPRWTPPADAVAVHRVRSGETLSEIADRYHTSVRELMRLNRLRSANRIWPGQRLNVPGGRQTVATTSLGSGEAVRHRVRSGDSLWRLASRYGTTVDRIRRDNNLSSNVLRPGQVLTIRGGSIAAGG